ncbi:MAG: hypothetical protein EOO59_03825 [Hymenobacter sp.]|nr:MAG: hypothetical protein EOO59_03825 [Hymenobacter sp.]
MLPSPTLLALPDSPTVAVYNSGGAGPGLLLAGGQLAFWQQHLRRAVSRAGAGRLPAGSRRLARLRRLTLGARLVRPGRTGAGA